MTAEEERRTGLHVVQQVAQAERELRHATSKSLDTKAGFIAGGAVAVVALGAATGWAPLVVVGALPAIAAVACALWALRLRGVQFFEPDTLGEMADWSETDTLTRMLRLENKWSAELRLLNRKKAKSVKVGGVFLALAVALFFAGALVQPVRDVAAMIGGDDVTDPEPSPEEVPDSHFESTEEKGANPPGEKR